MKKSILLLATIAVLATCLPVATNAATQVYDLNADWSVIANPNGPWSYREDTSLLHSGIVRSFYGSVQGWVGLNERAPGIYKLGRDVIVLPGFATVGEGIANILWTAPSAGTIDISGAIWVDNGVYTTGFGSSFWALSHNGNSLSGGQFPWEEPPFWASDGSTPWLSPFYFSSGSGGSGVLQSIPVAAGDQMVLEIGNGSDGLLGAQEIRVNFTITLTPRDSGDPIAAIEDLALAVIEMNLQNGIENSLDSKLDAALNTLVDVNVNNDGAACNSLAAFISAVEAQRGNKLTNAQADQLIAAAQEIQALLAGGGGDVDTDGDRLTDAQEASLGTDPTKPDTGFDGLRDGEEITYGTDPLDPDSDNGFALDGVEVLVIGTNPLNSADDLGPTYSDADGDELPDLLEIRIGTDPLNQDTDGDGVDDYSEILNGTDPTGAG